MRAAQFFIGRIEWDRGVLEAVNATATYFHGDEVMRPSVYSAIWNRAEASTCRIYSTSSSMGWRGTECLLEVADVFVYPSHMDNSPNALVEAMLVGTPIAASFTGGIPTLLKDQEEGVLFPRGDAHALARALRSLFADRSMAAKLGHAARTRALRRNDPSAIAARTVEIYDEVIARSTARVRPAGGDVW